MNYIRNLPINDTPEMFGLHDNANITFAQNETFSLLNGILQLQPKSSSSAGRSREEVCLCFLQIGEKRVSLKMFLTRNQQTLKHVHCGLRVLLFTRSFYSHSRH